MNKVDLLAVKSPQEKIKTAPLSMTVQSDSMEPLLKVQQIVQVFAITRPLRKFDIIVFFENGHWTCHYVWKSQVEFNGTLWTKSLKNPRMNDFPVCIDFVLGIVPSPSIPLLQKLKAILLQLF